MDKSTYIRRAEKNGTQASGDASSGKNEDDVLILHTNCKNDSGVCFYYLIIYIIVLSKVPGC